MSHPNVRKDGRYEVIRTAGEEGRQIDPNTRALVLRRDRLTCGFCGKAGGRLEVDHVIPWSAGGSDDMDNLRTLCHDCNQDRSNFYSASDDWRRLPTAHECVYCTPHLLGEPDVVSVYCVICNKKAPGVPINPVDPPDRPELVGEEWFEYDRERIEIDTVAAKYRDAALRTIRRALDGGE